MNIGKHIMTAVKGFGMGAANVVPGVSGGTVALLTGIYGEVIASLNALVSPSTWKLLSKEGLGAFWRRINGNFVCSLAVGMLLSVFSLAKLVTYVMTWHPVQTWAFFFGLIIASAVYMLFDVKGWRVVDVLWTVSGVLFGVVICTLSPTETTNGLWFIFVCGALAVCTMILPGISGSFVLVILGKYGYILDAVGELDVICLGVFALGCLVGLLAFAKFLHWLLEHYGRQTMLVLIGFVIGSLVKVWPWNDMIAVAEANFLADGLLPEAAHTAAEALSGFAIHTDMHVSGAVIWAIAGMAFVWLLESWSRRKES